MEKTRRTHRPTNLLAVVALVVPACFAANAFSSSRQPESISFNRDIRPILANACFKCHGPDAAAREAGLRLDTREGATAQLEDGGNPIVPGDSGLSVLMERVRSSDESFRMPPPEAHTILSDGQIETLRVWIDAGAVWERHWSFIAPVRVGPPEVQDASWVRNSIDRFILERIERAGLTPSTEADRETLIRRVTLDLTGLPPTLEEIDAFLADQNEGAFERVVDRLLVSLHFGEHMAVGWLDLARYADTYGYQSDVARDVWPWRDWVIGAFNKNLPYDEFVTAQLAGDLLPQPTRDQKLATTFNRLHRQTNEGGSIEEEYRVEYVADRTQTFATSMLGLTLECARCHDHKFDPISQREYYEFTAFFANIDESGLYSHFTNATPTPTLLLAGPAQEKQVELLGLQETQAERALEELVHSQRDAFEEWVAQAGAPESIGGLAGQYTFDVIEGSTARNLVDPEKPAQLFDSPVEVEGRDGRALLLSGDNGVRFPGIGAYTRTDSFTLSLWIKMRDVKDRGIILHRSRAWTDAASQGYQLLLEEGKLSWSLIHFWPGNAIRIRTLDPIPVGRGVLLTATYDGSSRASGLSIYVDGQRASSAVVRDNLYKGITGGGPGDPTLGQRFRDRGFKDGLVDDVEFYDRELTPIEVRHLFDGRAIDAALAAPETNSDLYAYYLANHNEPYKAGVEALRDVRTRLAKELNAIPEIMTMEELKPPRETFILDRGSYESRLDQVEPATPERILGFPDGLRDDRLGLSEWLTDPSNPLASRVAVNRLWQVVFGTGLVATPADFGIQGASPSHPELLDWLAIEFVESGWDVKAMMRRMVLSATYRQASTADARAFAKDPENLLLARRSSKPLSAEMLRDQALFASGLLVKRIGGPSVFPYEPAGLWAEKSGRQYPQGSGEALYRRSLYTFWKRTSPPPSMMILDGAKRDICQAVRSATSTPLQSLVVFNDPQFVEAARVLAQRVMNEAEPTDRDRLRRAFRLLAVREPSEDELALLADVLAQHRAECERHPEEYRLILFVGESPVDESLNELDLTALALVCSTLMGHDAVMTIR